MRNHTGQGLFAHNADAIWCIASLPRLPGNPNAY